MVMALAGLASPARGDAPKPYPTDFGMAAALLATGSQVSVTYYGWEATTYFGHVIYAMTTSEYLTNLSDGCFAFYAIYRTGCEGAGNTDLGGLAGDSLFTKPLGVTDNPYLAAPIEKTFDWTAGSEIIFALKVIQDPDAGEYNWFFSGDPLRNPDTFAHLAYFPPTLFPDGVPGNAGQGLVPDTQGKYLFGFEDVYYNSSDWDFNNSIFAVDGETISPPADVIPEPASMTLLATGLTGLAIFGRRRRRGNPPRA